MTRTELFDKLLKHLYDNPNDYWNIDTLAKQQFGATDDTIIESIVDELLEKVWTTPKKDYKWSQTIHQNGRQLIDKYGSYSSFLLSEKKAQKYKTNITATKTVIQIGTPIIFGLIAAFFGWQNWLYQKDNRQKEKEIHQLQTTSDSLRQQLARQHGTSDSLQIILKAWSDTTKMK